VFSSNLKNKVEKCFLMFDTHKKIIFQNIFFKNVLCVCYNQLYYHSVYQKKTILSSTKNKINNIFLYIYIYIFSDEFIFCIIQNMYIICILPNIRNAKSNSFCIIHFLMNSQAKMATNLPANSLTHLIKHQECKAKNQ
jgi:hypothetical protein